MAGRPRKGPDEPVSERTKRRQKARAKSGDAATTKAPAWETPAAPKHLSKSQRAAWKSLVGDLKRNGILAQSDATAIELVATALGTVRDLGARIEVVGLFTDEGRKAAELQLRAMNVARPYVEQLALSPRGRHNLGLGVSRAQGPGDDPKPKAEPAPAIGVSPRLQALQGGKS